MTYPSIQFKVQYLTISYDSDEIGRRLDNFLMSHFKNKIPKQRFYTLLRKRKIRVNSKRTHPSYRLQAKDCIRLPPLSIHPTKPLPAVRQSLKTLLTSCILYEDNGLMILNKPSGLAVHGGTTTQRGLIEIFKEIYPKFPQLELAHRLDSETSGCLILAKKKSILREVHGLLRAGTLTKRYLALVKGQWKLGREKIVNIPLQKTHIQQRQTVSPHPQGKPSITTFKPIQYFANATLMEITPTTGRTHQIRVHAQQIGYPIIGDKRYGDLQFNQQFHHQYGLKKLFLHAQSINFVLPSLKQVIKVVAPLDTHLTQVIHLLTKSA